ncbi:DUF2927 domain-containing protein [Winogradskyella tangerina]|uniref:DUF2927 domain-containing protein n=1 Tax=Winogradskyella tangerina TaxID=2023240 RepID=UPI0013005F7B|nr:DUF2927 domain-containing protein [Winogradskyella tangerina]
MKTRIALLISALIVALIIAYLITPSEDYTPTQYDCVLEDYFKEIALKSEFGESPEVTTKWTNTMYLYIFGSDRFSEQASIVRQTIEKINDLTEDGFEIVLTSNPAKGNAFVLLVEKSTILEVAPNLFDGIDEDFVGYTEVDYNEITFEISKAVIYIDITEPIENQGNTIVEEVTQSLGLMNDSMWFTDSMFFQEKPDSTQTKDLSKLDADLIKMLYHPYMKPGMNKAEVEKTIKRILVDEN